MSESSTQTIMKLFRQFKLGNSLHKIKYRIDKSLVEQSKLSESEVTHLAQKQLVHSLADSIINTHLSSITVGSIDDDDTIEYGISIMALRLDDFKTIVEAAIQMLPEEQIIKIRNGETEIDHS